MDPFTWLPINPKEPEPALPPSSANDMADIERKIAEKLKAKELKRKQLSNPTTTEQKINTDTIESEDDTDEKPSAPVSSAVTPSTSTKTKIKDKKGNKLTDEKVSKGNIGEKSVERTYQKKTQLEHILLRPDTYIGSVEEQTEKMWVINKKNQLEYKDITYIPGLYKIFDEILVNAADNKQRDKNMKYIKVHIENESAGFISIENDGKTIPIQVHKKEQMYVASLIFGHLLTSSNFNDSEKKVTGGRNGFGAKLCNVFCSKFKVETFCLKTQKYFSQIWQNNMRKASEPNIEENCTKFKTDFTRVTFYPDFKRFGISSFSKDLLALIRRRCYDVAATSHISVFLNDTLLPITSFQQYVTMFMNNIRDSDSDGFDPPIVYEKLSNRWEIAISTSHAGNALNPTFKQVSFVNSIWTSKGGRHVDAIVNQTVDKLADVIDRQRKTSNSGTAVKSRTFIKQNIFVFVNCLVENPKFDSQTKETLTTQQKDFGSSAQLSQKTIQALGKCKPLIDAIISSVDVKEKSQLNRKTAGKKVACLRGIPKLDDANFAGTKRSLECTLIVTEGDSAKSLAVAGLSVIGRDHFGVFPLKGKILNVRDATASQMMKNDELSHLIKALGLQLSKSYETPQELATLRYGHIMIMTDQDPDGAHITGLMLNLFQHRWPTLFRRSGFIQQFRTPLIKARRPNHSEKIFFSMADYKQWCSEKPNESRLYQIKYYKGLGTSTSLEARQYFSDMKRHKIHFKYQNDDDNRALTLAFSKKLANERKTWLQAYMDAKREAEFFDVAPTSISPTSTIVTFNDFINRQLVVFSNCDNERSLPNVIDGLKPGQRKVLFTCLKKNQVKEIKVAQLAGTVGYLSCYHHGEQSLMSTIINLAHDFVGSNNVPLLKPLGQFGTRLHGGKDAASPRYIFTCLSHLTRLIFPADDDALLPSQFEDGTRVEPKFYCPIIPMVLVNGADGIGTGWSTRLPNYDPKALIDFYLDVLASESFPSDLFEFDENAAVSFINDLGMKRLFTVLSQKRLDRPWYFGYKGDMIPIETVDSTIDSTTKFASFGGVKRTAESGRYVIDELPIGCWTETYKDNVLMAMSDPTSGSTSKDKETSQQPHYIEEVADRHTDVKVDFEIVLTKQGRKACDQNGVHKTLKLVSRGGLALSSMVFFDRHQRLVKYESIADIVMEHFVVRLALYSSRRSHQLRKLAAEAKRCDNQARFVREVNSGIFDLRRKAKKVIVKELVEAGYDSDPVKCLKLSDDQPNQSEDEAGSDDGGTDHVDDQSYDFDYLLSMRFWALSNEEVDKINAVAADKRLQLAMLKRTTLAELWKKELFRLQESLNEYYEQRQREAHKSKPVNGNAKSSTKKQAKISKDNDDVPEWFRDEIKVARDDDEEDESRVRPDVTTVASPQKKQKVSAETIDFDVLLDGIENAESPSSLEGDEIAPVKKSPQKRQKSNKAGGGLESQVSSSAESDFQPISPKKRPKKAVTSAKTSKSTDKKKKQLPKDKPVRGKQVKNQCKTTPTKKKTSGKKNVSSCDEVSLSDTSDEVIVKRTSTKRAAPKTTPSKPTSSLQKKSMNTARSPGKRKVEMIQSDDSDGGSESEADVDAVLETSDDELVPPVVVTPRKSTERKAATKATASLAVDDDDDDVDMHISDVASHHSAADDSSAGGDFSIEEVDSDDDYNPDLD